MQLENKVAIITGAASGFGKATAELFAKEGAKLLITDLDEVGIQAVADDLKAKGSEVLGLKADAADEADVKAMVDGAIKEFGQIDILFNNAGVYYPGNVEETSIEDWQKTLDINLTGPFLACKYAMPYLKESKGVVINTGSASSLIGFGGAVSYAATKGGILQFTRALAVDYAKDGVRANCICPGNSQTGMTEDLLEDENIKNAFLDPIPLNRLGQPEDVAKAALFLASDQSSYTTGLALTVDGGWAMS